MKKVLLLPFLFLLQAGCNSTASELPIEMVAYNSLSEAEQGLIPVSLKDPAVTKENVSYDINSLNDNNYSKEQVYAMVFNDTESSASGNLDVYIDLDKEVAGKGMRIKKAFHHI